MCTEVIKSSTQLSTSLTSVSKTYNMNILCLNELCKHLEVYVSHTLTANLLPNSKDLAEMAPFHDFRAVADLTQEETLAGKRLTITKQLSHIPLNHPVHGWCIDYWSLHFETL